VIHVLNIKAIITAWCALPRISLATQDIRC